MAKAQAKSSREKRKPKSTEVKVKSKVPTYLSGGGLTSPLGAIKGSSKK